MIRALTPNKLPAHVTILFQRDLGIFRYGAEQEQAAWGSEGPDIFIFPLQFVTRAFGC